MKKRLSGIMVLFLLVSVLSGCSIAGDYSSYKYENMETEDPGNDDSSEMDDNYSDDGLVDDSNWDDGSYDDFYEDEDELDYYPATLDIDKWGFANSGLDKQIGVDGYYMTYEDWIRLTKNLSSADYRSLYNKSDDEGTITWYANVDNAQESFIKWSGSCFGMSATTVLVNRGQYTAKDLNVSKGILPLFEETKLSNAEITKKDVSAINYYYMQQFLSVFQIDMANFQRKTAGEQVAFLKNCAKTQEPFMISFFWCEDTLNHKSNNANGVECDYGHAIVGYGIERGDWIFDDIEYDNKIEIYDCSHPDDSQDLYDLYFNTDGSWTIPGYSIKSSSTRIDYTSTTDNAKFGMVSHDISHINTVDFITGEVSNGYSELNGNSVTSIQLDINSEYIISSPKGKVTIRGLEIADSTYPTNMIISYCNIDGLTPSSTVTVILPDKENYYSIETKNNLGFDFRAGSSFIHAEADSSGKVIINDNYEMDIITDKKDASTYIELVSDADDDITGRDSVLSLSQSGGEGLNIKPDMGGILVDGDDDAKITVGIESEGNLQNIPVKSETNNIFITNKNNDVVISEDANLDGKYDNVILSEPLEINNQSIKLSSKKATYTGKNISIGKAVTTGNIEKVYYFYYKDKACKKEVKSHKDVGTYYVQAYAIVNGRYVLKSNVAKLVINKSKESIKLKKHTYSVSGVSKKAQSFKLSCKTPGSATFKKISGNKAITVSKTGKVQVKKGLKAGKYKLKVKISSKNYQKSFTQTITITVKK